MGEAKRRVEARSAAEVRAAARREEQLGRDPVVTTSSTSRKRTPPPPATAPRSTEQRKSDALADRLVDLVERGRHGDLVSSLQAASDLERIAATIRADALKRANRASSWAEIGQQLGISRQAAQQMSSRAERAIAPK